MDSTNNRGGMKDTVSPLILTVVCGQQCTRVATDRVGRAGAASRLVVRESVSVGASSFVGIQLITVISY